MSASQPATQRDVRIYVDAHSIDEFTVFSPKFVEQLVGQVVCVLGNALRGDIAHNGPSGSMSPERLGVQM